MTILRPLPCVRLAWAQRKAELFSIGVMRRLLFIDPVAGRPYRLESSGQIPPGGTEATLLRIARGLSVRGYEVWISQSSRQKRERDRYGIRYVPFEFRGRPNCPRPDALVCLRSHKIIPWLRRRYSACPIYLWLHCFPGARRHCIGKMATEHDFSVIAVSHSHARFVEKRCRVRPIVIYNPLEAGLEKYRTVPKDPNSMIYFSSPHKGLCQVLELFQEVRRCIPELTLKVANPGYIDGRLFEDEGVINLGSLPHHAVLREVAASFCVFYPQTVFAETFGLVFAEANALGTPVLAHDLGAAAEILSDLDQLVDCTDPGTVIERLVRWRREGPPRLGADPRFGLDGIVARWEEILQHETAERIVRAS